MTSKHTVNANALGRPTYALPGSCCWLKIGNKHTHHSLTDILS